jgi:hypothetical protein
MNKRIAKEYIYLLVCIVITLFGFLGIWGWNVYWKSQYSKHEEHFKAIDKDFRLITGICSHFSSSIYECRDMNEYLSYLSQNSNAKEAYLLVFDSSPNFDSHKEFKKQFLHTYPNQVDFESVVRSYGTDLNRLHSEVLQMKDTAFSKILPWSEEDYEGWSGYHLFEVEPYKMGLSDSKADRLANYISYYDSYYDGERGLYVIPHDRLRYFQDDIEYSINKGWEAGDVMTGKKLLFYIFISTLLVFFGVRYFFKTIIWSVKILRSPEA